MAADMTGKRIEVGSHMRKEGDDVGLHPAVLLNPLDCE